MRERKVVIEQVANGYVMLTYPITGTVRSVHATLDKVLDELLTEFEGRSESGQGAYHGHVLIVREEPARDAVFSG